MAKDEKILKFPKGFLWGASTSAYQIEGGIANDWTAWEGSRERLGELTKNGLNADDYVCGRACDSYDFYKEDVVLAKSLNLNAYRLSLEWSRLEPREGEWDEAQFKHYRDILETLKRNNIKIVLTIWHWTNPIWLSKKGGWENKETVKYYTRFVEKVVAELGDLVDFWVTLNEPMVHVLNGYIIAKFPPNKKNLFSAVKVFSNLVRAHQSAYRSIHNKYPNTKVSFTAMINYVEPANFWNPIEWLFAKIYHFFWNHFFLAKTKKHLDYIGVDYYFHDRIVWYPPFKKNLNQEVTDMGWEIYPRGIYHVLKYLKKFKKPIIILENGLADGEDKKRAKFIVEHLRYVHKAISEGADVRGYFYWSLIDNFEWAAGWTPKFGLFKVDRTTFERAMRPSARIYAEIIKNNEIKF